MSEEKKRIAGGKARRAQVRTPRKDGWTAKTRRMFFEHLSATCNVRHAAAQVGKDVSGAYALRGRDAEFRESWQNSLEQGYARLETTLIARAGGTAGPIAFDGGAYPELTEATDTALALQLLSYHRRAVFGGAPKRRGGRALRSASMEELEAAILKQLSVLNKRQGGAG